MHSEADQKAIQKLKRTNYVIFTIFSLLIVAILIWGCTALYWRSFTPEKWQNHPDKREHMVSDLMKDHPLKGMTTEDVRTLLGPEDYTPDNQLRYYIGDAFPIDSQWLVLNLERNLVTDYSVVTD